jgi:hypothetical protein
VTKWMILFFCIHFSEFCNEYYIWGHKRFPKEKSLNWKVLDLVEYYSFGLDLHPRSFEKI